MTDTITDETPTDVTPSTDDQPTPPAPPLFADDKAPASKTGKRTRSTSKPKSEPAKRGPGRPRKASTIAATDIEPVVGMIAAGALMAGMGSGNARLVYVGNHIGERSPSFCAALADAAARNPGLARALEMLASGNEWGALAMETMALLIPIAAAFGLLPAQAAELVGGKPLDAGDEAMAQMTEAMAAYEAAAAAGAPMPQMP